MASAKPGTVFVCVCFVFFFLRPPYLPSPFLGPSKFLGTLFTPQKASFVSNIKNAVDNYWFFCTVPSNWLSKECFIH